MYMALHVVFYLMAAIHTTCGLSIASLLHRAGEAIDSRFNSDSSDNTVGHVPCPQQKPDRIRVFDGQSPDGPYKLTFEKGKEYCKSRGTTIASVQDLRLSWNLGYDVCACGWLSDGTARMARQATIKPCGAFGINWCGNDKNQKWNVYCRIKEQ